MRNGWNNEERREGEETHEVEHDFTQEHIFESTERRWIILGTQVLECLIEVRVGRRVVLVFRMKNSRL
jgi:hypothetical protein